MEIIGGKITGGVTDADWDGYFDYAVGPTRTFVTAPALNDARIRASADPSRTTSRALAVDVWLTYYDGASSAQVLDDDINGTLYADLVTENGTFVANVPVTIRDGEGTVSILDGIDPGTTYHFVVTDVSGLTPSAAPGIYAKWVNYEHSSVDRFSSLAPDGSASAGGSGGGTTPSGGDDDTPPPAGTTVVSETPAADGTFEATATITAESGAPATSVAVDTTAAVIAQLSAIGLEVTVAGNEVTVSGTATDIGVFDIPVTVNGTESQIVRVTIEAIEHTDAVFVDTAPGALPDWQTELTTSGSSTLFVTYVPTDLTADVSEVKDLRAAGTGISVTGVEIENPLLRGGRGAGEKRFKVSGTVTDYGTAEIGTISYRVGINRYTQSANVRLSSTSVTDNRTEATGGGSSGGGCDAGFGLFGLLAATGTAALLRRKG
ncbi:MAG: hypothetical protein LBL73_11705 [Synergistaceae bacterium]|nr:hypothetical protein [Synergistaceae bacterium]